MKKVGLIGCGAIGRMVAQIVAREGRANHVALGGVLVRENRIAEAQAALPPGTPVVSDIDLLVAAAPDGIAECTGHGGLRQYGPAVLEQGVDLIVISIGALADQALEQDLRRSADSSGARIVLPSGAVGGLDLLGAAKLGGLDRVVYTSRKKPVAWKGTPAEKSVDLDALTEARVFYTGKARDAATLFPQNANVAAAVGLAGIGLDATEVNLTADPLAPGNEHRILAEGKFGRAEFAIQGRTMPDNPKTSMLAGLSLARAMLDVGARIVV